jgi:hypothetical protein
MLIKRRPTLPPRIASSKNVTEDALGVSVREERANRSILGHFMGDLITDDDTWGKWKGEMPVIYNTVPH